MKFKSFSELNEVFASRLAEVELFEGKRFNYYKLLQHALSYSENDFRNRLLATSFHRGAAFIRLKYTVKSLIRGSGSFGRKLKQILILDQGRCGYDLNGEARSAYFDTIVNTIGRDTCTVLLTDPKSDLKQFDVHLHEIAGLANKALTKVESEILSEILEVIAALESSGKFSAAEMEYVRAGFHVFFEEFHTYYHLLHKSDVEVVMTDTHYHKEGAIAAMKLLGIKVVEIQHGLIAQNDLYYVYPEAIKPVRDRAFFPDLMLLYGDYWKRLMLRGNERSPDHLVVVGDYNFKKQEAKSLSLEKDDLIFIAAQKNMPEYYVEYTQGLLKMLKDRHPEWKLQLKLHPLEKQPELYNPLLEHSNFELKGNESDLLELMASAKIQISIYSTTFFDALGLDVMNFSIQNYSPSADYAADIIKEGVAFPLSFEDDPIAAFERAKAEKIEFLPRQAVYAEYSPEILLSTLTT